MQFKSARWGRSATQPGRIRRPVCVRSLIRAGAPDPGALPSDVAVAFGFKSTIVVSKHRDDFAHFVQARSQAVTELILKRFGFFAIRCETNAAFFQPGFGK